MGFNANFLLSCLLLFAVPFLVNSCVPPNPTTSASPSPSPSPLFEYDFYAASCPQAENIVREAVLDMRVHDNPIAPAILRLMFHDCFVMGCDGSVLLNSKNGSERDQPPSHSLKGFDVIEEIKSRFEKVCPGIVSCSDILVLAAREVVYLHGGPYYEIRLGRRDSLESFPQIALTQLPAPRDNLQTTLDKFSSRGFNISETVSLLGAHSIGTVHCGFIQDLLQKPEPSIDTHFLKELIDRCEAQPDALIDLRKEGSEVTTFGVHYFQSLVQNTSVFRSDQEFMKSEKTASWVRAYAANYNQLFERDFSKAMMKLSELGVLTGTLGEIRHTCSSVNTNV